MFEGQYVLWGGEHSLFTRKLQAMLNYLGVSYAFKLKSEASQAAVEARLGTHFIPGLETPEGWFLHDTTPIGLMLNHKYPDRPLLPKTPVQKIAAHLLEDWADEWFGRYAINSRWCYPDNVAAISIVCTMILADSLPFPPCLQTELTDELRGYTRRNQSLCCLCSLQD